MLMGDQSRDCLLDQMWTGAAPTCERTSHANNSTYLQNETILISNWLSIETHSLKFNHTIAYFRVSQ